MINYVLHLAKDLTIEDKCTIYHRMYLLALNLPRTLIEKLKSMQRSLLPALSGAYRSTNKIKLINQLEISTIETELECQRSSKGLNGVEKKGMH